MFRAPLPWEKNQDRIRKETVLPEAPPPGPCGVPGAETMALQLGGDPDPNRKRRGARGAAEAMLRESEDRGWGLNAEACRDRVNLALQRTGGSKPR